MHVSEIGKAERLAKEPQQWEARAKLLDPKSREGYKVAEIGLAWGSDISRISATSPSIGVIGSIPIAEIATEVGVTLHAIAIHKARVLRDGLKALGVEFG